MTSLTLYGTSVASSTLSTANKLATTTGGTETSKTTNAPNDSTQNYLEMLSQGGTGTDSASQSAPTGKGWLLDSNVLENCIVQGGNWSATVRMNDSAGFASITFNLRFYKRSSGGTYTSIGSLTLSSQSMSSSTVSYSFSASSLSSMQFGVGDKLYVDLWAKPDPSDGHWAGDPMVIFLSNSGTAGVANDLQITTPGYSTISTKTLQSRFLMRTQVTKTLQSRLLLRVQNTKTLQVRFLERVKKTATLPVRFLERTQITKTLQWRFLERTLKTGTIQTRFILQKASTTKTLVFRFLERVTATKTLPFRTRLTTLRTLTLQARFVMTRYTKTLQWRFLERVQVNKTLQTRTRLATRQTKTLQWRFLERVQSTKTLQVRFRYGAIVVKTLQVRFLMRTRRTATLQFRINLTGPRILSGGGVLFANTATGTATFRNFRWTQYPDPSLSLAPVLPYVSNSSVFWTENIPSNTTRAIAVSTDGSGSSWTDVTGQNGGTIPIINGSGSVWTDVFTSNTSSSYTSTNKTGGSAATVTYATASSRITLSGGSGALYLLSSTSSNNVDILCDMDESDAGGLVWCEVDTGNYYELGIYDDSSSGGFANQLRLYKVLSNTRSLLSSAVITFCRSTPGTSPYHRTRVIMQSGTITVYFDGVQMISYTDGSPLAAGKCGLRNDGGASRYYQFRAQALGDYVSGTPAGDIVTGKFLYTKIAPSSSDPTTSPQILTLTTSVRSPDVDAGSLIPLLHIETHPVSIMLNNEFDTLAKASGDYHWNVDRGSQPTFTSQLSFNLRGAKVAPFCLYSTDLLFTPVVMPSGSADLYRNMETIYNCVQTIDVTNEPFQADGTATSWNMSYPLYSAPTITINNAVQSIGMSGVDTGKSFYWTPDSTSITQASDAATLSAGTIGYVSYTGIGARQSVTASNASGQSAQAGLEQNSGIVEHVTDGSNVFGLTSLPMTVAQAQTYAQGLLDRFSYNNAIDLTASTNSDLLAGRPAPVCGQLLSVFLPEFGINNQQLLIVKITRSGTQKADGNVLYQYDIEATNGASLVNWVQPLF